VSLRLEPAEGLFRPEGDDAPSIGWLGQAGFWIDTGAHRVLIDPYLSDSLARKYAGTRRAHTRMIAPPATPDTLPRPDLVLVTHAHTDHLDPDTLGPLAARFPDLPFVVPRAEMAAARARIGPDAQLTGVGAGEVLTPLPGLVLTVTPAAHEARERDASGDDRFIGYCLATQGLRLAHPGDTLVIPELTDALAAFAPEVALFPVNGRDAARTADGIIGNMNLAEAVALAREVGAEALVPHHWGLFDFNTIDPARIDHAAAETERPAIHRPAPGARLRVVR
jgi:L-ascorbate metabolism protein UlaG (beta-lactamase superfamily)